MEEKKLETSSELDENTNSLEIACFCTENILKQMQNFACPDLLIKQSDIKLIAKKDYIKHPKENGYRSLHLVVEVPIFLAEKVQPTTVEIQIRTIAMDFWASLEHHLRYKADNEVPDGVRDELIECAKTISNLDYKMQGIHEELNKPKKKVIQCSIPKKLDTLN